MYREKVAFVIYRYPVHEGINLKAGKKKCCNSPQRQILLEMQKGGTIPTPHSILSQHIPRT